MFSAIEDGLETFERDDTLFYIWHDPVDGWCISDVVGVQGAAYWKSDQTAIVGTYTPMGTATGNATVQLGEHP